MRVLRWTLAIVLLVLSSAAFIATLAARYARSELLDTDRYVATVAPLASDPAVQAAVTTRVSAEIMNAVDIPDLTQQLATSLGLRDPQAVASLAAPAISQWVNDQVTKIVGDVVTSDRFANLWTEVNRAAHTQVNALLAGGGSVVSTQDADIVVDLGVILSRTKDVLISRGWTFASKIPEVSIPYTIAHVEALPKVQRAVSLLDKAATWLPVLAVLLLAAGVWAAPGHRRALLIGLLLTTILLVGVLAVFALGRNRYADAVASRGLNVPAALAVWDAGLRYLIIAIRTLAVVTLLASIWVYLCGPSRLARSFRRTVNVALDRVARLVGPRARLRSVMIRWHIAIAIVFGILATWWLLNNPTVGTALTVAALAALATAILTTLRRLPATATPRT